VAQGIGRGGRQVGERRVKIARYAGQLDAILGTLRPAMEGVTVERSNASVSANTGSGVFVGAEEALFLAVRLHQGKPGRRRGW